MIYKLNDVIEIIEKFNYGINKFQLSFSNDKLNVFYFDEKATESVQLCFELESISDIKYGTFPKWQSYEENDSIISIHFYRKPNYFMGRCITLKKDGFTFFIQSIIYPELIDNYGMLIWSGSTNIFNVLEAWENYKNSNVFQNLNEDENYTIYMSFYFAFRTAVDVQLKIDKQLAEFNDIYAKYSQLITFPLYVIHN